MQLRALFEFGGYWADLDVLSLKNMLPCDVGHGCDVVIFSNFERKEGWLSKQVDRFIPWRQLRNAPDRSWFTQPVSSTDKSLDGSFAGDVACVNLGFMWGRPGSAFLSSVLAEWERHWGKHCHVWSNIQENPRKCEHWTAHQHSIQGLALKNRNVLILPPLAAFPFPYWLKRTPDASRSSLVFGTWLPSLEDVEKNALAVNIWDDIWKECMVRFMLNWWRQLPSVGMLLKIADDANQVEVNRKKLVKSLVEVTADVVQWSVSISVGYRIIGTAFDFLSKEETEFLLCHCENSQQLNMLLAALLQVAAKHNWVSEGPWGGQTSLRVFIQQLHAHYHVSGQPDARTIMMFDAIAINIFGSSSALSAQIVSCGAGRAGDVGPQLCGAPVKGAASSKG